MEVRFRDTDIDGVVFSHDPLFVVDVEMPPRVGEFVHFQYWSLEVTGVSWTYLSTGPQVNVYLAWKDRKAMITCRGKTVSDVR